MPKKFKTKMRKSVAIDKLQEFLDRALRWNDEFSSWSKINNLTLVGSLAENADSVGDIDLCIDIETKRGFTRHVQEYLEWRKNVLGYAYPNNGLIGEFYTFTEDPIRYAKKRFGRFDTLCWDQVGLIGLTMKPQAVLIQNGLLIAEDVGQSIRDAKPITMDQAKKIIDHGIPWFPDDREDLESYKNTLSYFPDQIRTLVIERDGFIE